jgi:hypothetical protein
MKNRGTAQDVKEFKKKKRKSYRFCHSIGLKTKVSLEKTKLR